MVKAFAQTRHLTIRYIIALSSIALLTILGQIVIQLTLQQQSSDALVINIAGRQRMLSQRLSKAALALEVFPDAQDRLANAHELRDVVTLWQQSQEGLQHGNAALGLPGNNSATIQHLFATINPQYTAMLGAAQQILSLVLIDNQHVSSLPDAQLLPSIKIILSNQGEFLTGMDGIVSQYQREAEDHVAQQRLREFLLLGLTIMVLILEGLLVFRPAVQRLRQTIMDLLQANERITRAEVTRKKAERILALNEALAASQTSKPHARIVALHHYQVRDKTGQYHNVHYREQEGKPIFACDCTQYQQQSICAHSLTAAALHSVSGLQAH